MEEIQNRRDHSVHLIYVNIHINQIMRRLVKKIRFIDVNTEHKLCLNAMDSLNVPIDHKVVKVDSVGINRADIL